MTAGPARCAALGIVVADMAAALAFYRRLGLDVPSPPDADAAEAPPHAEATLPGGFRIMFDTHDVARAVDPAWTPAPAASGHRMALAFECDSPADVDARYADLTDAGYEGHLPPWDAFWGQRYATVHDPDGNPVDLFAPLPPA